MSTTNCGSTAAPTNQGSGFIVVIVLYILLAIMLGSFIRY